MAVANDTASLEVLICLRCKTDKTAADFYMLRGKIRRPCKSCLSEAAKAWKTADPQRAKEVSQRACRKNRLKMGQVPRAELPGEYGVITQERLKAILSYDPLTGIFTYRINRSNIKAGAIAGSPNDGGYTLISIDNRHYRAHRLAWLYMTGEWPKEDVDHENTDPDDNRWENLREATDAQNLQNIGVPKHNTSGSKGASWREDRQKWRGSICSNSKWRHLGYFDTKEEAHAAYCKAARELNGEFANFGEATMMASLESD